MLASFYKIAAAGMAALFLTGCSTLDTAPINASVDADHGGENRVSDVFYSQSGGDAAGDTLVGLTFSGGGTRAAAFSFGVLKGFADVPMGSGKLGSGNLLDRVDFVSGVSGGSVTAAYFGLKGVAALEDFRERFLIRNAEENLHESLLRPSNWLRIYNGGGNDRSNFPKWLDDNLFNGATFADVLAHRRPTVWINASDIANHAPFVFEPNTFRAFCSDLSTLPLSEAVAASAAVPFIFAPISLKTFPEKCTYETPPWLTRGKAQGDSALLRAFARSIESYRDPEQVKFVRLLDGGITDNYGLSGLTIARAAADTPYGPLNPRRQRGCDVPC